jgi:hypothetical protein
VDVRLIPGQQEESLRDRLQAELGRDVIIERLEQAESVETDPSDPWIRRVCGIAERYLGPGLTPGGVPYFTDASVLTPALGHPPTVIAAAKAAAHWTTTGAPLVLAAPVIGLLLDMSPAALATLVAALLLGTPVLSLLGGVGAALTLGLRCAGVLLILLILPLTIPALIFGSGAVGAVDSGISASGHFSLLGALLIFTALIAPLATAVALRIALE